LQADLGFDHDGTAFTVSLFDQYMKRVMPDLPKKLPKRKTK